MITERIRLECECEKCSHTWFPDSGTPKMCPKCKSKIWNTGGIKRLGSLADQLKGLSSIRRMEIFEEFELCCGMLRGQCTCEEEEFTPAATKNPMADKLAALGVRTGGDFFAQGKPEVQHTPAIEPSEDDWRFTADRPQHHTDTDRWYRPQYLVSNPKHRRTVEVDADDHEEIIRVVIR